VPTPDLAPTLPERVAAGVVDASLAALAWLLLERGVPALVAGRDPVARVALADALAGAVPEARRPAATRGGDRLVRVAGTVDAATPPGILRAALAATTGRSGLLATLDADDLAGVLDLLARQGLTTDEASFLGVVAVLGPAGPAGEPARMVVAHSLRPVVRDAGGHPRRLAPAVLAAWDEAAGRWEDFAWGIGPDLAERCRMRAGDFEAARAVRAALVADLVAAGRLDAASFEAAAAGLATSGVTGGPTGPHEH
jgi:hypothetical protein